MLDGLDENALSNWPDKVRVLPVGQPLLPPVIALEVLENVQAGLLMERCLLIQYRKRGEAEARTYRVHPQALVWRDAVGYLLCSLWNYDDIVQLVLHRMESVEIEDTPRRAAVDFSLDAEIASGSLDFLHASEPLLLEAMFHAFAAVRLRETPIAENQELIDQPDGRVLLRATLADTVQLRTWLQSIGEFVEVIGPAALRAHMAASARALVAVYGEG